MSIVLDETAADVPVRDSTVPLSVPLPSSQPGPDYIQWINVLFSFSI